MPETSSGEVTVQELAAAVQSGDLPKVRSLLNARPELIGMDMAASDEHRALHYAVLKRDAAMVRLLMEAGADARKGIYPHREATSAITIAHDRDYDEIHAIIEQEEQQRRQELSCPNASISPVQDQIAVAIANGETATAIRFLESDPSLIHACDRQGATPLHLAAEEGDSELITWLLQRRANVHKQDLRGLTPLDRAALAADPRNDMAQSFPGIARLLLNHGASGTIYAAVALADAARIHELIQANPALLRRLGPEGGLLTLAVNHGHASIVALLLDLGADVDEREMLQELEEPTLSWGKPLWYAALADRREIARLLLAFGADPNANVYASGWPLRNAWNHPGGELRQLLLAHGAQPQPYMIAESHDFAAARRLLLQDPNEEIARELAWSAADHGCPGILELALARLDWAPSDPRWHWVIIQPVRGAGPDQAANEGHFACLSVLLRHGVHPDVSRFGQTVLHFLSAHHGPVGDADRARFAALLLDHHARLDVRDDLLRSTPLGWACRWGRRPVVELLLARGAPVHEPDAEPWATPLAWAMKRKHEHLLPLLQ